MRAAYLLISVLAAAFPAAAEKAGSEKDPPSKQLVEITKTVSISFPAGGLIRFLNSTGDLNIESWDKSNIEITTIKSTADLYAENDMAGVKAEMDKVTVKAEQHGNEVLITTFIPHRSGLDRFRVPEYPTLGHGPRARFNLEYHISVPRSARLVIEHRTGGVNVDDVTGDIDAHVGDGQITLHLPEDEKYNIDAKARYGTVNSDYPGEQHRVWIGQKAFAKEPGATHTLKLRVGYGDIVLLKTQTPRYPDTGTGKSAGGGQ